MKKDITMKKNSFVNGIFVTTIGIVISKILGILYVIPFFSIIGESGGALYGYAYTIYTLFMSLASAGIPLSISKIVSEYQALGYYSAKKKVLSIGIRISLLLGFLCFVVILLFAPFLAHRILGDIDGVNTVSDVAFVIRVIGTAILIVPVLSVYRGYFEGHRFMNPPSISQVIEQLIRVLVIIIGSFLALRVFHLSLTSAVGIALFGATVGALAAYLYLIEKKFKNKQRFDTKIRTVNEPIITNKVIFQKILYYAVPFIMIDIFKSLYGYIDMITVDTGLFHFAGYSGADAETIYSIISTWAQKFNMIILSVSTGVIVSLIPNLSESIVLNQKKDTNKKINQALSILIFLAIPMTFGISFLARSIWMLFYGTSVYGPSVLSYYVFSGLMVALFTATVTILQAFKDFKIVFISLLSGVVLKFLLNTNLLISFHLLSLPAYYGVITASILGYLLSFIICMVILRVKYHVLFEAFLHNFFDVLGGAVLMILVLFGVSLIVPVVSSTRVMNLVIVLFYACLGMVVYFLYAHFMHLTERIFGKSFFTTIRKILLKK